jgi:predicted transcriptional regulator
VAGIASGKLDDIWDLYGEQTGLDRCAYDGYFKGRHDAVAIQLTDVQALRRRVPLAELRRRVTGFRPPQSFCYVTGAQAPVFT